MKAGMCSQLHLRASELRQCPAPVESPPISLGRLRGPLEPLGQQRHGHSVRCSHQLLCLDTALALGARTCRHTWIHVR